MIYLILSVLRIPLVFVFGRFFKKNLIPEIVVSFLVGVSWEIVTAPLWIYNTDIVTPFYVEGQAIPLEVLLLCSSILSLLSLTIGLLREKILKKSVFIFLSSIILFLAVGWLIEYVGTQYSFWSYSWSFKVNIFSVPVVVLYGWIFQSALYLSPIQFIRKEFVNLLHIS